MQRRWREGTQRQVEHRDHSSALLGTPSAAHLFVDHRPSTSREVYELCKVTRRTLALRTSPSSLHGRPIDPVKLNNGIPTRVWPARVRCHMVLDILPEAGETLRQEAVLVAEIRMELLRREVWSAIEHNDEFQQCRHLVVRAPLSVERPRSPAGAAATPECRAKPGSPQLIHSRAVANRTLRPKIQSHHSVEPDPARGATSEP